jgi:2-polyprenyl-6-methoxyphenol hydroxylase-like FAD-dependent oxidoreductase
MMPANNQPPRRILVVGLGIAGSTLAWWLAERGFVVSVVERAPSMRTGGYMIDFWGLGYDVAERMGLLPELQTAGYRIEALRLVRSDGRPLATVGQDAIAAAAGDRFVSLMRGDLGKALVRRVRDRVDIRFGDHPVEITERRSGVSVVFEMSPPGTFDLVIGAGGVHSELRHAMFPDARETPLDLWTAAFSVPNYPHRDPLTYVSFTGIGWQVARYALRDGSTAFFFAFRPPDAPFPITLTDQRALLRRVYAGQGWECQAILEGLDTCKDLYFDTVSQVELPRWSQGRLALVGDAAYCPSLLAGEGASLAMAGAYVLAGELQRFDQDYATAFARYEQFMRPLILRKQRGARRLTGWFAPKTHLGLRIRNGVTRLAGLKDLAPLLLGGVASTDRNLPDYRSRAVHLTSP